MKNDYEIRGEVTAIIINSPKYGRIETLISTSKLKMVDAFPVSWGVVWKESTKSFYVRGHLPVPKSKRKIVYLHRWITNAPDGMDVDHFYHDTLDNTDNNIRLTTYAENQQNRNGAYKTSKTGIRGVCWNKKSKRWFAQMQLNGKVKHLGSFKNIEEAEIAAIQARAKYMSYSHKAS